MHFPGRMFNFHFTLILGMRPPEASTYDSNVFLLDAPHFKEVSNFGFFSAGLLRLSNKFSKCPQIRGQLSLDSCFPFNSRSGSSIPGRNLFGAFRKDVRCVSISSFRGFRRRAG